MFTLKFQEKFFSLIVLGTYVLYFLILLGISSQAPVYLSYLEIFIKVYVSLFLIIRFNPFTFTKYNHLDRRIAFSAGLFLFSTSIISEFIKNYLDKIKNFIESKLKLFK